MKKLVAMVLAFALLASVSISALAQGEVIDWFNESEYWMTVANGQWSEDPADKITDEELEKMFSMVMKQQCAVHWTPYFFIAVKDVEEQRGILGDMWDDPSKVATEGTVTVLLLADQILTQEEGHASEYSGTYMPTTFAYYDSGLASGLMGVAAASLGYYTHYFGSVNGEYAPKDVADGKYQSLSRYVKDEYTRVWGFRSPYNGEIDEDYVYPVKDNCVFVAAIVIGKPKADTTMETWGTNHARPDNWAIWD